MAKRSTSQSGKKSDQGNTNNVQSDKRITISNLGHSGYELKKKISISIRTDQNMAIASYDKLDTFGLGPTEDEAVLDLLNELCEIYQDLETNPGLPGSKSAYWWDHLQMIMSKKANT